MLRQIVAWSCLYYKHANIFVRIRAQPTASVVMLLTLHNNIANHARSVKVRFHTRLYESVRVFARRKYGLIT